MQETTFHVLVAFQEGELQASEALGRLRSLLGDAAPSLATFYRSLKGALDAHWVGIAREQPGDGRGRPAQVYRLTPAGRKAIEAEVQRLESLAALGRADRLTRSAGRPR